MIDASLEKKRYELCDNESCRSTIVIALLNGAVACPPYCKELNTESREGAEKATRDKTNGNI
jgi:hypothetical protein